MKKHTKANTKGAALLIYLLIMALFIGVLMIATYSRLLLAVKRGQSTTDSLVSNYSAESEINDLLARLSGEYFSSPFSLNTTKQIGSTTFNITGTEQDGTQMLSVTADRAFASTKIIAERRLESIKDVNSVDIVLSLDCTGSMDAGANCTNCNSKPTRFNALEDAAVNFVDNLSNLPNSDKFHLGVSVFGADARWLSHLGQPVTPSSGLTFSQIKEAIQNGFGDTRNTSPACTGVMDLTSIGSAFAFSHDYFAANKPPQTKQVEIVITDGEPNSRIPYAACSPSVFCPGFPKDTQGNNYCESNAYNWTCTQYDSYKDDFEADGFNQTAYNLCAPQGLDFLRCTIADTATQIPSGKGARNPDVDAYAVTILSQPPADVVSVFNSYLSANNYFNASRASQLKNLLNTILNEIVTDRETISIKKDIPG